MSDERSVTVKFRPSYAHYKEAVDGARRWGGPLAPPGTFLENLMMPPLMWLSGLLGSNTWTVSQLGIVTVPGDPERKYEWAAFNGAFETERLICLMIAETGAPLTLPKEALSVDDLALVRRWVESFVTPGTSPSGAR